MSSWFSKSVLILNCMFCISCRGYYYLFLQPLITINHQFSITIITHNYLSNKTTQREITTTNHVTTTTITNLDRMDINTCTLNILFHPLSAREASTWCMIHTTVSSFQEVGRDQRHPFPDVFSLSRPVGKLRATSDMHSVEWLLCGSCVCEEIIVLGGTTVGYKRAVEKIFSKSLFSLWYDV